MSRFAQLMRAQFIVALSFIQFFQLSEKAHATGLSPTIKTLDSYSRLTIPVSNATSFKVQGVNYSEVVLGLEGINPLLYAEAEQVSDSRIASIKFISKGSLQLDVKINKSNPGIEYFAYFQPAPPAVVVDFWLDKNKLAAATKAKTKVKREIASTKAAKELPKVEAIPKLGFKEDFFFHFPVEVPKFDFNGKIFSTKEIPNIIDHWQWPQAVKGVKESINYSLALKLFKDKKYALCIKTIKLTKQEYPDSQYTSLLNVMEAFSYKRLSRRLGDEHLDKEGEDILRAMLLGTDADGKAHTFVPVLRGYFASQAYIKNNWLDAVEHFESLVKEIGRAHV